MPVVAEMRSNSANDNVNQKNKSDLFRPIHATNIKIAKKIPAFSAIKETKGRPDIPPGQDKEYDLLERAATGILGASLVGEANKYAVVIGICDYPGTSNDICLSDGDSYNMVTALIENYGYDPENIYWFRDGGSDGEMIGVGGTEMSYEVPSYDNIYSAVMGVKNNTELSEDDEVVFFFSGHGGSVDDTSNDETDGTDEVILIHDGSELSGISDDMLQAWFNGFNTERIVFIFDTCLAGGMNDVAYDENNEAYNNRVVVMSSKETQYSYVYSYGEFGEGMFSRHFVNEGMLQGLADGYNQIPEKDYVVVMEEAFDYAKENFPSYLKFRQNPVISDSFIDDLFL